MVDTCGGVAGGSPPGSRLSFRFWVWAKDPDFLFLFFLIIENKEQPRWLPIHSTLGTPGSIPSLGRPLQIDGPLIPTIGTLGPSVVLCDFAAHDRIPIHFAPESQALPPGLLVKSLAIPQGAWFCKGISANLPGL